MTTRDKRQEMLAGESIGRLLFKLSAPAAVGSAVMASYNVINAIFIGQVIGPLGIAGVTIVFPLQMLTMGLGMMIGMGGASIVSRTLGAGEIDRAERTLGNAVSYVFILGVLFSVVGLANSSFWLRLVGASDSVLPYAKEYFDIIFLSVTFRIGAMGISQFISAEGNARVAMVSHVTAFAVNIVLDVVFILYLGMGIKGAAIATVLAEATSFLYTGHYYLFRNSTLKIRLKNLVPNLAVTREMVSVGFGSFVMTVGGSLTFTIILRTIAVYGGDLGVAAAGILQRTVMFVTIPLMSIGRGLQPILGFSYGSGRVDRAVAAIKLSVTFATLFAVLSFLVIFIFPGLLIRMFTPDADLISMGSHAARLMFLGIGLMGVQAVAQTVFQSLGKAVPTFLTTVSRQMLFFLPAVLILPRFWQLDGVWLSYAVADVLSFVLALVLFLRLMRELRNPSLASPPGRSSSSPP
jgi:putative MATE family efflux protein